MVYWNQVGVATNVRGVFKFVNDDIKTITENGDYHDDILQIFEDEFSNFVSEFHNSVEIESGDVEEEDGGSEMQLYCQQGGVKSPKKKSKYKDSWRRKQLKVVVKHHDINLGWLYGGRIFIYGDDF